jgi:hypothetical protein
MPPMPRDNDIVTMSKEEVISQILVAFGDNEYPGEASSWLICSKDSRPDLRLLSTDPLHRFLL